MNFQQEFGRQFGDRFQNLQLKSVVVKKSEQELVVTFVYPFSDPEISQNDKNEIISWMKDFLSLEKLVLRVKFLRVFVEEKLILKEVFDFLRKKHKLVCTYVSENNFSINITPIDVLLSVELSSRLTKYFIENRVADDLARDLKNKFLTNFVVNVKENSNLVDEVDLDLVEIKGTFKVSKRFDVEIVKEIVGKDIPTKPEMLCGITSQKANVIVAGFVNKLERREFVVKKGRDVGQTKSYFLFELSDGKDKIDCIHFCSKTNLRNMESLEDCMYVLCQGDVRTNQFGKLQLVVDKMALANLVETQKQELPSNFAATSGVVKVEKLFSLQQDNLFEKGEKYNQKISGNTIVVFDIETTGLDNKIDQIIELGAVKISHGQIVEKFSTFVKPSISIPPEVVRLTGITNEMVADAPPVEAVIRDFYDFSRDCILCGHNVINFDINFVRREGKKLGLEFDHQLIDTIHEARSAKLGIVHLNLAAVLKALGLKNEGAHRAWNDAYATAQALLKMNVETH